MPTWQELVDEAIETLAQAEVADPENSARWIGRQATGTEATEWLEVADRPATKRQLASFDRMIERRKTGEPLQYVVGSWGFRTLDLMVDHRVLIPRPETEVVAGYAIDELDRVRRSPQDDALAVADLGTGSGAIGLAMAAERPQTEVWLTDVSADALAVARANLAGLGTAGGRVRLAEGSWFDALPSDLIGHLAVVVSNPPYVASVDELEPTVARWEPALALLAEASGGDGRAHLDHLVDRAPAWLRSDGALVLEMDPRQVAAVAQRARTLFAEVEPFEDLVGRLRGLIARYPGR